MGNNQKHWQLSLDYSMSFWDGSLDFQDGHSKEYLDDGGFAQDNSKVPLALVRVPLRLQRETENHHP